ncbi:hypothetical protein SMIR_41900 (plasmid) [Streptomyces mirabilis]|nr:hypothetical protein SMIR_41900 [Streptomyces mirabilis]
MRLRFNHPRVQRSWTVELRPQPGGPVLVCQQCPHTGRPLNGPSARAELLAHLALHARRAPLPTHLRTCQCHERGCCWHRRHRGCQGPIRLLLARERGGRLWRLTDACTACSAATSEATVVPDTILTATTSPTGHRNTRRRSRRPKDPDSQTRVREMLSYLASALPADTGAAARLIALQCALRMSDSAQVLLPLGILRSLRLGTAKDPWRELKESRWLRTLPVGPEIGKHVKRVQLLDSGLLGQCPARPDRLRAADWALRTACRFRMDAAPLPRLATLCLAARTGPGDDQGVAEPDHLARECGLTAAALPALFLQLTTAGVVSHWNAAAMTGDLHWVLKERAR